MVYSRNEIKRTTTRIYDRINRTATVTFTNKEGKVKDKTIEKFDEKWRNTELLILDNMGNQSTRVEYSYNRNDCKIESKRYNRLNELYAINKNTYNSNNHRILQEKFKMIDGNFKLESESHTVHVYDEIGNCIEHAFGPIDKPSWIIKTSYEYN